MLMIHRRFLSWLGLTAGALMLAPASANVTLNLKEADISTLIATVSEVTARRAAVWSVINGLHTAAGQEFTAFFRRRRTRSEARRTHPRTAQEDAAVEDEYVDEQLRREDRTI